MGDDMAASNLDNNRTSQFVDNVTFIRGKHAFRLGGDIRKLLDDASPATGRSAISTSTAV